MGARTGVTTSKTLSIAYGMPLSEEPGLGALTMPGYLREVTARYPKNEACVYRGGREVMRWSYAELYERAMEVARTLIACGIGKDSRVGILMTNRPEFLAAMFGTALAGGVAVILNTFSTPTELEHLVRISGIQLLMFERKIAAKDFAHVVGEIDPAIKVGAFGALQSTKFPFLRRLATLENAESDVPLGASLRWPDFLNLGAAVPDSLVEARAAQTKPSDAGALFFSSGSTSMPKGILHAHRAVALQWWRWPWVFSVGKDVRIWTANGFFWSGQFSLAIGMALTSGGSIVLQSTFQAEEALALWDAERVTIPIASPHQWARLQEAPNYADVDLSALRYLDYRNVFAQHPTVTPTGWHMPVSYGTTETLTINVTYPADTSLEEIGKSWGRPLGGNVIKIFDPDTGETVPMGARGEIAIKGPTLMMGYLGKTADETFDPEGYYKTGDGGYLDETGRLYFEGRLTDIIKTGGANVSPVEIDLVIRAFPGVKVTQTVGVPHDTLGEMVVTCIVPQDGVALDEAGLREFMKERLASYKIPRQILYFRDEELTMTGSAKVKAGALRQLAAARLVTGKDG